MHRAQPSAESKDPSDYRFRFAETTMAVILGVLLVETPRTLRGDVSLGNYQAVLLLTSVFVFVEMYIVLGWYHVRGFGIPYRQKYLFLDAFISFSFVGFVILTGSREGGKAVVGDVRDGLIFGVVLFALLVWRQAVVLRLARRDHRREYQKRAKQLWVPIVANFVGMALLVSIRVSLEDPVAGLSAETLSQIGLAIFVVYALLAHAVFDPGVRLRPAPTTRQ